MSNHKEDFETLIKDDQEIFEPSMYKVVLHNDNYTPMDFVVQILRQIFSKNTLEAEQIMLNVHTKGKAVAGVYTYDIANTKVNEVVQLSKVKQYPLRCSLEEN